MLVEMSDADLAHRIAAGHREAEAELFRRLAPRIRLYGLRHLRSAAAADDLVQQVLLTTIEALRAGRLRESDKLAQFVLGTCRLTASAWRRTSDRQRRLLEEFGEILVPEVPPTVSYDEDQLARCLQALGERERSVMLMTFYAERTTADVGAWLGVSDVNVRVIRHRAMGRLRACMGARS
jgi:RNA polymerase sigma-70 factor (ECF subfamily)